MSKKIIMQIPTKNGDQQFYLGRGSVLTIFRHPVGTLHRNPVSWPRGHGGNTAPIDLFIGVSARRSRWERCTETRTVGPAGEGECRTGGPAHQAPRQPQPVGMLHRNPDSQPQGQGDAALVALFTGLRASHSRWGCCTETRTVGPWDRGNAVPIALFTRLRASHSRWERCTEPRTVALVARGNTAPIALLTGLGAMASRWERLTEALHWASQSKENAAPIALTQPLAGPTKGGCCTGSGCPYRSDNRSRTLAASVLAWILGRLLSFQEVNGINIYLLAEFFPMSSG